MKQTNNAIKFLMAQYRAIFRNANLKMFLAAATAAAALAAGQAQAAQSDGKWDAEDFTNKQENQIASETITQSFDFDMDTLTKPDKFDSSAFTYAGSGTTTIKGGATVNVAGKADKHMAFKELSLEGGATLAVRNDSTTNTMFMGNKGTSASGAGAYGTFTVNNAHVIGEKTMFWFNTIDVKSGSSITLGGLSDLNMKQNAANVAKPGSSDKLVHEWYNYSSIASLDDGSTSGDSTYSGSTVTLNHESALAASGTLKLDNTSVTFNGQTHKEGYATSMIHGKPENQYSGSVVVQNGSSLNVVGDGAIYGKTITLSGSSANIAKGKKFTLDGNFVSNEVASGDKHEKTEVIIKDFSFDGEGTLIIGNNSATASTVAITGDTIINTKLDNNAAISVNKNGSLTLDASMIAADKGVFAGKSGSLAITEATLNLNGLSGDKTLNLADAKQIAFTETAAHNKVAVTTAGKIVGGNLAISDKIAGLKSGTNLSVDAENLTLGSTKFDSTAENALGIGAGELKADNVTFINKDAKPFVLKNDLELENQGKGTIKGSLQVGSGSAGADVSITAGDYTLEAGKDLLLVKSSGASTSALTIEDAKLTVSGKLATKATDGVVSLNDGTLDASKATAYEFGANTFKMSGASALSLDGSKWITLGDASGDLVKFKDKVDAKAVSGNNISTLTLTGIGSMTMDQFKELKDDTGFTGLFEGFNVTTKDPVSGSIEFGKVETGTPGSVYHNAQAIVDAPVADKTVNVGSIKLKEGTTELSLSSTAGSNLTLTNAAANGNTKNNFVSNSAGEAAPVSFSGTETVLVLQGAGNVGALDAAADKQGAFVAGSFDGSKTADVVVKGNIGDTNALNVVQAGERSKVTVEGTKVNTNEFHSMPGSSFVAKNADVSIGGNTGFVTLMGDINAKSLAFTTASSKHMIAGNAHIEVGTLTAPSTGSIQVGDDSVGGLGATVVTSNLKLNGGSIFVDPSYGNPAALVVTQNLTNATANSAGELAGDVFIGRNAAMGIGFDNEDQFKASLADYLDAKGSFSDAEGKVKNALVINNDITLLSGNGVVLDAELTTDNLTAQKDTVAISAGSNLIITDNALKGNTAAITFKNAGTVSGAGTITLAGDFYSGAVKLDEVQLFKAAGATLNVSGNPVVELAGGLYKFELNTSGKLDKLGINADVEKQVRAQTSAPVGQFIVDYAGQNLVVTSANKVLNDLIDAKNWAAVDAAAHAATYAGAQQAAVASVTTMAEAVGGRVGSLGVEAASIAATGSQANGGVWVTPMYKSVDADGFAAEGVSYGADVDLAGVAFGADTVNGNMRFGAVFNIGSGDADGKGQGNGLKDEFDYYGIGIYSAMGFGSLAIVGDASLNVISHDVEGLGLKGEADTTAVTMGVTGQYTISNPMVDVTPHLGARFIRLDTDSYDLTSAGGVVATTDFDVQNVFSIPLGVTLSKAFEMGGWALAPSADLSITFNTGDTDANSTTSFAGVAKNIGLTTEVLDEVTYGVAVGLGAQYGAFGTNFGINYTGSENTDSFGVNAQARYMF